jgi:starch synthase
MTPIHVLAVASEFYPLVKTGGLADVTGALPRALGEEGVSTTTLLPGFPGVLAGLADAEVVFDEPDLFGALARLLRGKCGGLDVIAVDAPQLFARAGNPYTGPDGGDWPDNAVRFAALARMAARVAALGLPGLRPDVVHAHDWQAGLTAAYLAGYPQRPGTVFTVHNLAFQGLFPAGVFGSLGLPAEVFSIDGVEFHGMVGYLKAGLAMSDRITTVSPGYAREILTPEAGMNLDGLLRHRADRLVGILNGIDTEVWDPANDPLIAARFDAKNAGARAENKRALRRKFGVLESPEKLLLGVISRLTWQKGLDLLLACLDELDALDAQLLVLGTGERGLEEGFRAAADRNPKSIGCVIGYDESLAHLMQAGADALVVPSRFEPCGLTQLCALRYGALPIVARTGGLADTVIDANEAALAAGVGTGLQFAPGELGAGLRRAAALWRQPATWRRLRRNAMRADVSWRRPARKYAELYRELLK